MKFRNLALAFICFILFFGLTFPASAQDAQPGKADAPTTLPNQDTPARLTGPQSEAPDAAAPQSTSLQPLKAVLIVGPIDPQNGNVETQKEINNMELAAARLEANGVAVTRLYTPNDSWANVVAAAQGANFLLYRGHGLFWGSPWPTPTVGGFELSERMYSGDEIKRDLKLAPNAIVMLYACLATGSSTTDEGPISRDEALRRVSQYSQPFLELGAAGYYGDWFGDAFQVYIDNLFSGMTLGDAFKNYYDYQPDLAITTGHQTYPNVPLILSWDNWVNYTIPAPQYNSAFVGQASKTLWDLYPPNLLLSTHAVSAIVQPSSPARTYEVAIQSSNSVQINWTATPANGTAPAWVSFTPTSGKSGTTLKITLTPPATTGKFQTNLVVTNTAQGDSQTVTVTLVTTSDPSQVFLPNIIH